MTPILGCLIVGTAAGSVVAATTGAVVASGAWVAAAVPHAERIIEKMISAPKIDINLTDFIFFSYLICVKPANIFIRETLVAGKIESISDTSAELKNAGKLIGILERILVLTFVIIGKLEVVGFLIAAKSILRYKDTNTIKTEYVLIGTMLSFGIAMMIGLAINKFWYYII